VIPGVSRSGITMTAGLFQKMKRETAARFSFLLSTPIIAGAALKKGMEIRHEGLPQNMHLPFLCGIIVSALVGYLVIAVLIRYLERRTFKVFVVYRIALGVILLALGWGSFHGWVREQVLRASNYSLHLKPVVAAASDGVGAALVAARGQSVN
jgi:undecaprenyl-diphosphatase